MPKSPSNVNNEEENSYNISISINRCLRLTLSMVAIVFVSATNILSVALLGCDQINELIDIQYTFDDLQSGSTNMPTVDRNDRSGGGNSVNSTMHFTTLECETLREEYLRISPLFTLITICTIIHFNFFVKLISASLYLTLFTVFRIAFDGSRADFERHLKSELVYLNFFILVILLLNILDREVEQTARSDFLWRAKLRVEQDEVETMGGINKILLENILPAHVAQHFLIKTIPTNELYAEKYNSVAVMFASIPNYTEFYDENDINKQGLECLRLLNEIICDFDKILLKPKFSCIEKIKTIGSTYMAAAGLLPGRESMDASSKTDKEGHFACVMVEFSLCLMAVLEQINRESFQRFKLRVGLNSGPVIAGVVGAQKPQYDIWGNTVNVASRMDSCGIIGKIQLLQENGYDCQCRGKIQVKGKGDLVTYFVQTSYDGKHKGSHY
ncbi:hypothetical protein B4U79_08389 [Dinothrombium tinctorium]|uniref:adenylate cyclase n=1 Tax=Dinothrombium tinctorium TaxID=1965070 RepID=A0A3S3PK69_9ACAR|nr:hypothetical protein B4U79_08389 [Dinothrombium tinctorium]